MNLQKMSKSSLIKKVNELREYIYSLYNTQDYRVDASNPDLDDSFLQLSNVKNQRQLGIVQAINFGKMRPYLWSLEKIPSRDDLFEEREKNLKLLKKLWDNKN